MKVTKNQYLTIFNVMIVVLLSLLMSFVMVLVNIGLKDGFEGIWFEAVLLGCLAAIPVTFLTIPAVGRLLSFIKVE